MLSFEAAHLNKIDLIWALRPHALHNVRTWTRTKGENWWDNGRQPRGDTTQNTGERAVRATSPQVTHSRVFPPLPITVFKFFFFFLVGGINRHALSIYGTCKLVKDA